MRVPSFWVRYAVTAQAVVRERAAQPLDDGIGHRQQRGVERGRVLALQQAPASRPGGTARSAVESPSSARQDLRGPELVVEVGGREGARDRDRLHVARALRREALDLVGVERRDLAAVVLEAAVGDHRGTQDRGPQVGRPRGARLDRVRAGSREPQHAHAIEAASLDDGIGGMGRAQHRLGDARPVDRADHALDGAPDAVQRLRGGGDLDGGQDGTRAVHHDRIGVGATDIDAEAQGSVHQAASPKGT